MLACVLLLHDVTVPLGLDSLASITLAPPTLRWAVRRQPRDLGAHNAPPQPPGQIGAGNVSNNPSASVPAPDRGSFLLRMVGQEKYSLHARFTISAHGGLIFLDPSSLRRQSVYASATIPLFDHGAVDVSGGALSTSVSSLLARVFGLLVRQISNLLNIMITSGEQSSSSQSIRAAMPSSQDVNQLQVWFVDSFLCQVVLQLLYV